MIPSPPRSPRFGPLLVDPGPRVGRGFSGGARIARFARFARFGRFARFSQLGRFGQLRRLAPAIVSVMLVAACSSAGTSPSPAATAAAAAPGAVAPSPASPSAAATAAAAACPTSQPAALPSGQVRTVTLKTSQGTIVIKVEGSLAPIATGNFVALTSCGYYDNVVFHRLVPGFVIQGGDGQYGRAPNVDASRVGGGSPGYSIKDEPVVGDYVRGTVAMARTSAPNSQGAQFFICLADLTQSLDKAGDYVILGHVTSGMDVVDKIAALPNSGPPNNQAINPVAMTSVTVTNP
jgi:peptidyl-prolyl cis-trans isomerase B (cyclophilin B)